MSMDGKSSSDMKIKMVYALVSSASDFYLEQAYVSMFSLKHHMPDAYIVLVTDDITSSTFEGVRKKELQYADEIISIHLDASFSQRQRSRLIKTSVRRYVSGDYLYIDCDTIICRPFQSLGSFPCDIAACVDSHCLDYHDNPYRWFGLIDGHALEWSIDDESTYFNSGVLFVKDSSVSHEFYDRWQQNLLDGFSKGVLMDQPAFAKTNYQMGHIVRILDDNWNCELKHGIRYLKDAMIVHYLTTNTSPGGGQVFRLNEPDIFNEIRTTGAIPAEVVTLAEDPFAGLSSLTHLFAGKDIYFFQTASYKAITSTGIDYKESLISPKEKRDFVQTPLFFFLLRRYPHGFTGWLNRVYNSWIAVRKFLRI